MLFIENIWGKFGSIFLFGLVQSQEIVFAGEVLDPFFRGFMGQQFYFPAEAGQIYNLFTSQVALVLPEAIADLQITSSKLMCLQAAL